MLHSIRRKEPLVQPDRGPAGLLTDCHQRIRTFSQMAVGLSTAVDVPADQVSAAANRVHRYFSLALPLHEQDEESSLRPRLLALSPDPVLTAALDAMVTEHRTLHGLLELLSPAWGVLVSTPEALPSLSPTLIDPTRELHALFAAHLTREETVIFPRIDALPAEDREAIRTEMRDRRGESWHP